MSKKDKSGPPISIFRWLEYWAADMEERRLSLKRKRYEEKLEKSKALGRLEFHVAMADWLDDIRKMHKLDFGNVIQQFNTMINAKISDVAVVVRDIMGDAVSRICGQFLTTADDIDRRAAKRHDQTVNYQFGLLEQLELMELNADKRHLETMERLRLQDRRIEEFTGATLNSMIGVFEKITQTVDATNLSKPNMEWLIDNIDKLEHFTKWFKFAKDNSMPRNVAVERLARDACEMVQTTNEEATAALDALFDQMDGCSIHQIAA